MSDKWADVTPDEEWADVKTVGPATPWKAEYFKDTKELLPNLKKAMDAPSNPKESLEDTFYRGLQNVGGAVWDVAGALPAMVAGGVHGIYEGATKGDLTAGLKTGSETMHSFLPSTLANKAVDGFTDVKSVPYQAIMAPVTASMDAVNAIPTRFSEVLNYAGFPEAAAQYEAGGKLSIMVLLGAKGAKEAYKAITGKEASSAQEAADKLERLRTQLEAEKAAKEKANQTNPNNQPVPDRGVPGTVDQPQGELFSKEATPTNPIPSDNQMGLFERPPEPLETIPYEPLSLGEGANHPGVDRSTMEHRLEQGPQQPTLLENSSRQLNMEDVGNRLELASHEEVTPPAAPEARPIIEDTSAAKAAEQAAYEKAQLDQTVNKQRQIDEVYAEQERAKNYDHGRMEGQKELDFNESVRNMSTRSTMRQAFLDRANLDFKHLADEAKDSSLMEKGHTVSMRAHLRNGDVRGALSVLVDRHPLKSYRELAQYLMNKVEGLNTKLHDESVIRMGDRDVTGYYDPQTHTVGLSGLGASSPHTVLHEIAHAVSSHFINVNPRDMRVTGLKALFNTMSKERGMKEFPGIVNVKEFVAEAFSNPRFQEFLKGQQFNNKSVWRRFVDGIKSMLGLKGDTPMVNAFEHAMDLSKQVVEAQTGSKGEAAGKLRDAGLTNKLADLMAQKPTDVTDTRVSNGISIIRDIPGLESAVSDFTFYDKPIGEIIEMAKNSPDIPNSMLEKAAQELQAGGLFESLKTRNPVVKKTFERVSRAWQESSHNIKQYLTDPETGLKKFMRDMNDQEKGEIHTVMMEHEGVRELSSTELAAAGFNEKQIAYYNRYREQSKQFFDDLNARRAELGLAPMDARVGHMAGRFMGDFAQMVYKDGKVVGRIAGNTKWELARASKYMMEHHPDFEFGPHEYNAIGKGRRPADRFGGLMEALNFLSKADGDVGVLMESYRNYLQKDALNFRNTMQHAKDKVKDAGGVKGSEGNKPWKDAEKNAVEGMKAQLSYFEQGYEWMAMEHAVSDLKPLLGDGEVAKQAPNAVDWSQRYINHSMGRGQGKLADAANWMASFMGEATGIGHTNLLKGNAQLKHLVMQKFMGLGNIPFTLTQLMQPFQTQPAMIRLLRSRGLEFSTSAAQLHATETYLHSMIEGHDSAKMTDFQRDAMAYADRMSIFDVKMADHTKDINSNRFKEGYNSLADLNITAPEHLTRGMSFLFYAHLLKDAGIPAKDVFGAAENMTNFTMVNYHPMERPMGYAKLGWLGDVASTLTRYKHNQYSQLAFYGREGLRAENGLKSSVPLATFLGTSLAFGGAMGFFAYNEADALYQMFSEHVLKKPNSLTNLMLGNNLPEFLTHGLFSSIGLDMTTRFSNANLIPDSVGAAVMPYGSAVWDIMQNTGRLVLDPTSPTKQKQLFKSVMPQSVQGLIENNMFTEKTEDGRNLYINNTDGPNFGKGRVYRTEDEMKQRAWGFRSVAESKELAQNYSDSQIEKAHGNIVDGLLSKVKYSAMDGSLTEAKLKSYVEQAAEHGEDPSAFVGKYAAWAMDNRLSQQQQRLLRNAQNGYKGAFNMKGR